MIKVGSPFAVSHVSYLSKQASNHCTLKNYGLKEKQGMAGTGTHLKLKKTISRLTEIFLLLAKFGLIDQPSPTPPLKVGPTYCMFTVP